MDTNEQEDLPFHSHATAGSSGMPRHRRPTVAQSGRPSTTPSRSNKIRDSNPPPRKRCKMEPKEPKEPKARLACHFFRADPFIYNGCAAFRLHRFGDVLQHLERKHPEDLTLYCSRCSKVFNDEHSRDKHITAGRCAQQPIRQCVLGISPNQFAQIKSMPPGGDMSQKWTEAWRILFPLAECPDPFMHAGGIMMDTMEALRRCAVEPLQAYLNTSEGRPTPEAILDIVLPTHQPVWPGPPGCETNSFPTQPETEMEFKGASTPGKAPVTGLVDDWYAGDDQQQQFLGAYSTQVPYTEQDYPMVALPDVYGEYLMSGADVWGAPDTFEEPFQSAGYVEEERGELIHDTPGFAASVPGGDYDWPSEVPGSHE